ncbi:MAG: hypothetical protein J0I91_03485 [Candidatus Accumulibacter sp.]|nr:hypothetical protein [Accumulibacter sp.]
MLENLIFCYLVMSTKADKKIKLQQEGLCRLTGMRGRFVASHILPRALTVLSRSGEKVREASLGARPRWRPATWYDDRLVIKEGEDILREIDTPAIEELRKHKLVWSSFKCDAPFFPEDLTPLGEGTNLREICLGSADKLRMFFLSIVWRAAASSRPEFVNVQLTEEILEDLRQRVLAQDAGNVWDYPIVLDQLITRGAALNRTPIMENMDLAVNGIKDHVSVVSVRIYLDGLVAKVILAKGLDLDRSAGGLFLGALDKSVILARPFEQSRTKDDMIEVISDNQRRGYA